MLLFLENQNKITSHRTNNHTEPSTWNNTEVRTI